jgi:hypothetical protein
MANEISAAVKAAERALPSGLTWGQAIDLTRDEAISLFQISGKVAAADVLSPTDCLRLADKIVKHQAAGDISMPKQTEAGDAMTLADNADREYILAAAKRRAKLQENDTESIFDIAARLKKAVETERAADAQKPAATLSDTDRLARHRPGWRTDDGTQWRHDRRKRRTTEEYDRRQQATYVSTSEEEDDPEKSLSDGDCYKQYNDYVTTAWKQGK